MLGKAVAAMPEVVRAKEEGYLLVGRGSTNAYILEELLGSSIEKERYVAGQVVRGVACALHAELRSKPVSFHNGEVLEVDPGELLPNLGPEDVLLKGANAVDHTGKVGVLMASPVGGTMGQFYLAMKARGGQVIYPVGLEKLVPSVERAARFGGIQRIERALGVPSGMVCVADGTVVTEIEALERMFDVTAVHFASGGYGGSEGAVTMIVEGEGEQVERCMDALEEVKGEPPLNDAKGPCGTCEISCGFQGKEEKELPYYLR